MTLLEDVAAAFDHHTGGLLPELAAGAAEQFAGLREHALAWAVRHLRERLRDGSWSCVEDAATANAVTHVAGFLHFVATWSHHPLFPAMLATAGERGFSLHGLAPFAAAHAMFMMGNRISFPAPTGYPGRIEGFAVASGGSETVTVHIEVFDRFEYPFGQKWDPCQPAECGVGSGGGAQGPDQPAQPGCAAAVARDGAGWVRRGIDRGGKGQPASVLGARTAG